MKPQKFTVTIPQEEIDDLKSRLQRVRWPKALDGKPWSNGTDLEFMQDVVAYWHDSYDWRTAEAEINAFDNYKVTIDDVDIHFIHQKNDNPDAETILLTHGWPDSFYRFHAVIPILAKDYNVVVPSLPGYGFSTPKGMGSKRIADIWAKLMKDVLGYDEFFAGGGDTGAPVTMALARQHGDVVKAIHLTDVGWGTVDESDLAPAEKKFQEETSAWYWSEGAYTMLHATKPLTLAYALNDSPVGLAAWAASFANRGKDYSYADEAFGGRDAFLTTICIYWFTGTIGSSMQMYKEEAAQNMSSSWGEEPAPTPKCDVPTAVTIYLNDAHVPKEWAERQGLNVQRYTVMDKGGHFAAMELPEVFAKDVKDAFTDLSK
ncbi:MAG TPA: epoxide hydrolase [Candidatus Saccharimonadales bacterium]